MDRFIVDGGVVKITFPSGMTPDDDEARLDGRRERIAKHKPVEKSE